MVHPVIIHFRWGCSILNQQFLDTTIHWKPGFSILTGFSTINHPAVVGTSIYGTPSCFNGNDSDALWGSRKGSDYQELEARAWISRLSPTQKKYTYIYNMYIITYVCIMVSKHIRCKPAKLRGSLEINSEMVPAQFFLPKQCVHTEGFLR